MESVFRRWVVPVVLITGGVLGRLSIRPGPEPAGAVSLSLRFAEGDVVRERFRMAFEGELDSSAPELAEPVSLQIEGTSTEKVLSVDQLGVATIETSMDDISTSFGLSGTLFPPFPIRVSEDGRLLSLGGIDLPSGSAGTTPLFWDQTIPNLPDHVVREGDTWSKEYDQAFPFTDEAVHVTTKSRLLRFEAKGGTRAALIETRIETAPFDVAIGAEDLAGYSAEFPEVGGSTSGGVIRLSSGRTSTIQRTWFDFATGTTVAGISSGDMSGSMQFHQVGGAEMDLRITGRMSISSVRIPFE